MGEHNHGTGGNRSMENCVRFLKSWIAALEAENRALKALPRHTVWKHSRFIPDCPICQWQAFLIADITDAEMEAALAAKQGGWA